MLGIFANWLCGHAPTHPQKGLPVFGHWQTKLIPGLELQMGRGRSSMEELPKLDVRLMHKLGGGSSGVVWKGIVKGGKVAIKQFYQTLWDIDQQAPRREYDILVILRDFMPEVRAPRPLTFDDCIAGYAMSLVEGINMGELDILPTLSTRGLRTMQVVLASLLEQLQTLHKRGYVHRDVKPANTMVSDQGVVTMLDWGNCTRVGWGTNAHYTLWWCSPWAILGKASPEDDVFAGLLTVLHSFVGTARMRLLGFCGQNRNDQFKIWAEACTPAQYDELLIWCRENNHSTDTLEQYEPKSRWNDFLDYLAGLMEPEVQEDLAREFLNIFAEVFSRRTASDILYKVETFQMVYSNLAPSFGRNVAAPAI